MKTLAFSVILLLFTWVASAQRNNNDPIRNNIRLTPELFRFRNDQLRLQIMRQRLLEEGRLTRREIIEMKKAEKRRKHSVKKRSRRRSA